MNKVKRLGGLLGGLQTLGRICDVTPSAVTKWKRDGHIPIKHNRRLRTFIGDASMSDAWKAQALDCLDPDVCPTCGHSLRGKVV
jgi:hypothetical protein